jgi:hypothetical protein
MLLSQYDPPAPAGAQLEDGDENLVNLEIRSKIIKVSTFSGSPAHQQH